MEIVVKKSEIEYFNDPVIDSVKQDIIENIMIYSNNVPNSIQNLVASHYSKPITENNKSKDETI